MDESGSCICGSRERVFDGVELQECAVERIWDIGKGEEVIQSTCFNVISERSFLGLLLIYLGLSFPSSSQDLSSVLLPKMCKRFP